MKNTAKALLFFAFLLFLSSISYAQGLAARVDRTQVAAGETFNLIVTATGQANTAPDFSAVTENFTILGKAETTQVTLNGAQSTAETQWILQLAPKRAGNFTIPAFNLNGASTQPITIDVSDQASTAVNNDKSGPFLEASVVPESAYVQSQILYTARLFTPVEIASNLQSANLSPPEAANTVIKQIGKYNYYTANRNGRNYQVAEARYALFPQQSGELTIKPAQFKGNVLVGLDDSFTNDAFFTNNNAALINTGLKTLTATAPSLTVQVQAQATHLSGNTWLPAKNITLTESWSGDLATWKVGQPLTRTISIKAVGLTAEQLPDITIANIPHVNHYPDLPVSHTTDLGNDLLGQHDLKIAYVPTAAGNITIPAINLHWWNTQTKQEEVATLPAQHVNVLTSQGEKVASTTVATTTAPTESKTEVAAAANTQKPNTTPTSNNYWPWLLTSIIFIAWIGTLVLWQRRYKAQHNIVSANQQKSDIISLRATRSAIKQACRKNDPLLLKHALVAWAEHRWPKKAIRTLGEVNLHIHHEELRHAIKRLDYVLYAEGKNTWSGKAFWQIFAAYLHSTKNKKLKNKNPLPSLYPKN